MAFTSSKFSRLSSGVTSTNAVNLYSYKDTATDSLATIQGSGYFDSVSNIRAGDLIAIEGTDGRDFMYVVSLAPVVTAEYNLTSVANGSITEAKLAANSCTEAKMDAATAAKLLSTGAVTADHLAANSITEADFDTATAAKLLSVDAVDATHIAANAVGTSEIQNASVTGIKLAVGLLPLDKRIHTTTGGNANEDVTIAGVVATDVVIATMHTVGATPRLLDTAVTAAGKITLGFSDDPSTDHKVNIIVYRP